jgi:hypothetical protein
MQRTRLNGLLTGVGDRTTQWASNPWRRLSLVVIGLLLGFFIASGVSSTTGQLAIWDVSIAAFCVAVTEVISRLIYAQSQRSPRIALGDVVNALKIGFMYGLFLEAFKLNS